jgi:hypothetical protein
MNGKGSGLGANRGMAKARKMAGKSPRTSRRRQSARCRQDKRRNGQDFDASVGDELYRQEQAVAFVYVMSDATGAVKEPILTLSQRALSHRLQRCAGWIYQQGDYVSWCGETWARMEYSDGRCAGYKLISAKTIKQ